MLKKVCHISTAHEVFDDRIFYKECVSLSKAGYEVYLVIRHHKNEKLNNINIVAIKDSSSRLKRMFFKPFEALILALKTKAKIFHFHDPELIFVGIILKVLGKKVIYDAHENVPSQILSKAYIQPAFVRILIAKSFNLLELIAVRIFDRIISVVPEILERFPAKKGVLIRNLPILSFFKTASGQMIKEENKTVMVYAGGLTKIRGIKEIITSMKNIENVELCLIGKWEDEHYFAECKDLAEWKKVNYIGFIKLEEVFDYISKADIGLCILYPEPNYLKSLPVKAFEYMLAGIPIIMSDFPYWKKIFGTNAIFVNPKEPLEIEQAIKLLIQDKNLVNQLSDSGKTLVTNEYSWEAESKKLLDLYQKLLP